MKRRQFLQLLGAAATSPLVRQGFTEGVPSCFVAAPALFKGGELRFAALIRGYEIHATFAHAIRGGNR